MPRILVIEDNEKLAAGLRTNLEYDGHEVRVVLDGTTGLAAALEPWADLVLLDLMLPGLDGYAVLRAMRDRGVSIPVLVLTALGEEADKLRGFRVGADDYVTKPFGLLELLARVEALLRRARGAPSGTGPLIHRFGDVEVDGAARTVTRAGARIALRPREFDLLLALCRRRGEVLDRGHLLRNVWGYGDDVVTRTVDTHVAELRRKLEVDPAEPRWIVTVPKAGYRLAAD